MAIRIERSRNLSAIEFVSKSDDALDLEKSDFDAYLSDADQKHLAFLPDAQPTVFVLNFDLSGKELATIKNAMGGVSEEGEAKVNFGSWANQIVRVCLKEIRNPPSVPLEAQLLLKRDKDGKVGDETLGILGRYGITEEIFSLFNRLTATPARAAAKNS